MGRPATLALLLLLLPACGATLGDQGACAAPCEHIAQCTGGASGGTPAGLGWRCSQAATCDVTRSCQSRCILQTPCAVITAADPTGLPALRGCMTACTADTVALDAGPTQTEDSLPTTPVAAADLAPPPCVPQCQGRQCGDDGCGGQCGSCPGYLVCDKTSGTCRPNTPPSCWGLNECLYDGQLKCTGSSTYRTCVKSHDGCLTYDCST